MVKNLIMRAILGLALLTNVIYANAQAYEFESYESDQSNMWFCDCLEKLDNYSLRFQLSSKKGATCAFSFIYYGESSGLASLSSESKTADVKLYLSNGEILSTTEAIGADLWIFLGSHTLKSSMSNANDKGRYAMGRLREYDITKITVNGKEYPTPNFRSAVTINAMCKEIISHIGDQGQFGIGPSTVPISANISDDTVEHNQKLNHSEGISNKPIDKGTSADTSLDAEAMNKIGNDYFNGRNGKTKDYTEAVKWYRKSAEKGNANGQFNLGYMYDKGLGVAQDYTEAVRWYRKAAEQGQVLTDRTNLAICMSKVLVLLRITMKQ